MGRQGRGGCELDSASFAPPQQCLGLCDLPRACDDRGGLIDWSRNYSLYDNMYKSSGRKSVQRSIGWPPKLDRLAGKRETVVPQHGHNWEVSKLALRLTKILSL